MADTRDDVKYVELNPKDKKLWKIFLDLFKNDKIPDEFYRSHIEILRDFSTDHSKNPVELIDIWKGVVRDVSGGLDGSDDLIQEYIREKYLYFLEKKSSKAIQKLNALARGGGYGFDPDQLERLDADSYTTYDGWLKMGCDLSTDNDIVVFCPESANRDGGVAPLFSSELRRLESEMQEVGLDTTKYLDINQIIVVDRRIVASGKGGEETANIILATYHLHPQKMSESGDLPHVLEIYPLDEVELDAETFETKLRATAKYVWDYAKYLMPASKYQEIRDLRIATYDTGARAVMTELHQILGLIVTDPEEAERLDLDMTHWRSDFKTLTMKFVQAIVFYHEGTMKYAKVEIAQDSRKIAQYYELPDGLDEDAIFNGCLYNLTRGAQGEFVPGLCDFLIRCYQQIVRVLLDDSGQKTRFVVEREYLMTPELQGEGEKYPGDLTYDLIRRFLESPKDASSEFEELWTAFVNGHDDEVDRTVNQIFVQSLDGSIEVVKEIYKRSPALVKEVMESQFIWEPQRTEEWKQMLTFYKCGNNGAEIGESFQALYNLIRGSILEEWCYAFCPAFYLQDVLEELVEKNDAIRPDIMADVVKVIPFQIGLIVEQKGMEGCKGAAPDLLLICLREIGGEPVTPLLIPVEMKGLKAGESPDAPRENADYRRGLSLAKRQVSSVKEIVDPNSFIVEFGLVILTWIHSERMGMEVWTVPL